MKFAESLRKLTDAELLYAFRKLRGAIRKASESYCTPTGLSDTDIKRLALLQRKRGVITSEMLNRISIPLTAVYEEGSYEDV